MAEKKTFIPTAEYFEKNKYKTVHVKGYGNDILEFKIKNISLVQLMSTGKITSTLMKSAMSLFDGKKKEVDINNLEGEQLKDMMKLVEVFCKNVMVEPTYEEVGKHLEDSMLFELFGASTQEVTSIETFREESTDS